MALQKRNVLLIALFLLQCSLYSCVDTKKAVYFNNIQDTVLPHSITVSKPIIQPNDLLSISVTSLNPDATAIFNQSSSASAPAGSISNYTGALTATGAPATVVPTGGGGATSSGYLVNSLDSIKFPVLGSILAGGLTKEQLETEITDSLVTKKLLVSPLVTVRFLNFRVTVLGEVARPSTINVANERISILEALGLAGDLTIFAKRDNVLLIREQGDAKIIRRLNLNSSDLLSSPYYYLKTNDIVYVEPNRTKVASAERSTQLLPIFLSALSLIAIIVSYFIFKS